MASPEPLPINPDDLIRRLNIVREQQRMQDMKLAQKVRRQNSELYKLGRKLHLRSRKNAEPASTDEAAKSQLSISSSDGESRKSTRWGFRSNPTGPSDDDDTSTTAECSPQYTNTIPQRTTSARQPQARRTFGSKKHGISHQIDQNHAVVLDLKDINEDGDGHIEDSKENCPPSWDQTDSSEAKPRGLQLLKRITSVSALKPRRGSDGREATRIKSDPIKEEPAAHRRTAPFLKIRR
ncbi:hypothetical protein VPNG_01049 [Cytospora leucostoma]|uniref:Uncharacterized protein n=1 Tax=Cytospora leucostoma TaxID=1230097 RepID=A0A423XLQ2_9PEZI|nr:hypothetical protein VPNG_01049 [Cytospora leucostoma]